MKKWQQEQTLEDLKLELDTLCEDISLYKQQDDVHIDDSVVEGMEQRLVDTYRHAEKRGLVYNLEDT